jgi:hypothetical protein
VSDFSLPPVQSAITVLLIDAHKEDREYWTQHLLISSPDYVVLEAETRSGRTRDLPRGIPAEIFLFSSFVLICWLGCLR